MGVRGHRLVCFQARQGKARQGRAGSVLKLRPGTSPPSRMGAGLLISPGTQAADTEPVAT